MVHIDVRRIDHPADLVDRLVLAVQPLQLRVEKSHVERCVVNDQLSAAHELVEVTGDLLEQRLVLQELVGDAVDFDRALVLDPEDSKTFYNRAMVLAQLQKFDEAVADLKVAETLFEQQEQIAAAKLSRKAIEQLEAGTFDPLAPME